MTLTNRASLKVMDLGEIDFANNSQIIFRGHSLLDSKGKIQFFGGNQISAYDTSNIRFSKNLFAFGNSNAYITFNLLDKSTISFNNLDSLIFDYVNYDQKQKFSVMVLCKE